MEILLEKIQLNLDAPLSHTLTLCRPSNRPIDIFPSIVHNVVLMGFARCIVGLSLISALLFTAGGGWCAEYSAVNNLDHQIAERAKQYRDTLRQRAQQLSPSLQSKIELQAQRTVVTGSEKWKNGEIDVQIALPGWVDAYRAAQFVTRHLPFPGAPTDSFVFGGGQIDAILTVTTVHILKVLKIPATHSAIVRYSSIGAFWQNRTFLSYFTQIVCSIVQRR